MSSRKNTYRMVLSAMLLALALVLPFLTGQIPQIGGMLCPMHIPVLVCGFFCGPFYGMAVGFVAPLLRSAIFGQPQLVPTAIAMCFELATYGLVAGLMYKILPRRKIYVYPALVTAMVAGRIVWGVTMAVICKINNINFGWKEYATGAFVSAIPGIIIQIIVVPILVMALSKYTYGGKTPQASST